MDQTFRAVSNTLYHIILAGIIHRRKYTYVTFDIQRESVVLNSVFIQDLLSNDRIYTALSDLFIVPVNYVGAAAGDKEVGLHKSCDKRRQSPDLSSGTQPEQMACFLIFADLLHILRRKLSVILRFVKIQCSVKVTCKYFLHISALLPIMRISPGPKNSRARGCMPRPRQITKSSLTEAFIFQILTLTSPEVV